MLATFLAISLLFASQTDGFRLVEDADKNGFEKLKPIHLDVDGDGKIDTIRPHTVTRKGWLVDNLGRRRLGFVHWISFDLIQAQPHSRQLLFEYRFGDERADYWIWALIPAGDLDGNGQLDFVFYSGDDTTDETVILLQKGSSFRKCGTGNIISPYGFDSSYNITTRKGYDTQTNSEIPVRIVGHWNGGHGWYEGTDIYWVHRARVALRSEPRDSAKVVEWLGRDDAVINLRQNGKPVRKGPWIKVDTISGSGWVQTSGLVTTSRYVTP